MKESLSALYAIVDAEAASRAGWRPLDLARAFLDGGARFLQLRAKVTPGAEFLETAAALVTMAHGYGARVIVNDRADIARLAGADGVHVGQDDLAPGAVRAIAGVATIVGLSAHTLEQVDRAVREPITYAAIGPVFATTTKATGHQTVGVQMVREASRRAAAHHLPLVAIGGITIENAGSVLEAGAASVAVIADLLATGDPARQVRNFLRQIGG